MQIKKESSWIESERFFAGLRWAAKRVGTCTYWLDLFLSVPDCIKSDRADKEMMAAFGSPQHLGQLLCLQAEIWADDNEAFLMWLLRSVPNLVALNMGQAPCPFLRLLSFQFLRHLRVIADSLPCTFQPAEQLPVLQTLCLHRSNSKLQEVNLMGCRQLSKLVMKECSAQRVLLNPACHFSADLGSFLSDSFERVWWAPYKAFLWPVHSLSLCCQEPYYACTDNKGLFARLPCLAALQVAWPKEGKWWVGDGYKRHKFVAGAECLLTNVLASDGPPLLNLRTIIITAISMQACIPGNLPSLEELVILAEGRAELSFEDPVATILALKKFYAFGQPLKPDGLDIARMSIALAGTGQALGAAVAQTAGKGFDGSSSCVYLRPAAAEALPMQRLYDLVAGLTQGCRCGACFDCLSKAGRLDF